MTGHRRADAQITREIGKQAHGGEFGGADGKAAHSQREVNQIGMRRARQAISGVKFVVAFSYMPQCGNTTAQNDGAV